MSYPLLIYQILVQLSFIETLKELVKEESY